jgi:hypothetical protein
LVLKNQKIYAAGELKHKKQSCGFGKKKQFDWN